MVFLLGLFDACFNNGVLMFCLFLCDCFSWCLLVRFTVFHLMYVFGFLSRSLFQRFFYVFLLFSRGFSLLCFLLVVCGFSWVLVALWCFCFFCQSGDHFSFLFGLLLVVWFLKWRSGVKKQKVREPQIAVGYIFLEYTVLLTHSIPQPNNHEKRYGKS